MDSNFKGFHHRLFFAVALVVVALRVTAGTFTDANWTSMGGIPGADNWVYAAAADASGNLYIGGEFNIVGSAFATHIAKWDGTNWAAMDSGIAGNIRVLRHPEAEYM